jgi:hypothetical protein
MKLKSCAREIYNWAEWRDLEFHTKKTEVALFTHSEATSSTFVRSNRQRKLLGTELSDLKMKRPVGWELGCMPA